MLRQLAAMDALTVAKNQLSAALRRENLLSQVSQLWRGRGQIRAVAVIDAERPDRVARGRDDSHVSFRDPGSGALADAGLGFDDISRSSPCFGTCSSIFICSGS